ncbi:hypothetical protein [Sneathiella sp.]|uniref:hypothetical protein n=1 Tax=Sneathiella sp. TaxID=1964365 RepID=UPI0035679D56
MAVDSCTCDLLIFVLLLQELAKRGKANNKAIAIYRRKIPVCGFRGRMEPDIETTAKSSVSYSIPDAFWIDYRHLQS